MAGNREVALTKVATPPGGSAVSVTEDGSVGVWSSCGTGWWQVLSNSLGEGVIAGIVTELHGERKEVIVRSQKGRIRVVIKTHTLDGSFMSIQAPSISRPVSGS